MGHRLQDHKGGCRYPHGHNYKVTVEVAGDLNEQGMVVDFKDLKEACMTVFDEYDHSFMCQAGDPFGENWPGDTADRLMFMADPPTAEHLAYLWAAMIRPHLPQGTALTGITVYESSRTSVQLRFQ
jgi:6-pyruvoyltetrahydropterin/6-carboxytetrahydropterin synthase